MLNGLKMLCQSVLLFDNTRVTLERQMLAAEHAFQNGQARPLATSRSFMPGAPLLLLLQSISCRSLEHQISGIVGSCKS